MTIDEQVRAAMETNDKYVTAAKAKADQQKLVAMR
jgi:hypothetical protein